MESARERLLAAAARRFYANGITATGVDTLIADAKVAKMSLYNNFSSKDDLVTAYLHRRHNEWLELFNRRLAGAHTPRGRVLAVFDAYLDHAELAYEVGFRGCGLLNGAAELPVGHPGREAVRGHKAEVQQLVTELVAATGVGDPELVGEHIYLLVEGAMVSAGLDGSPDRLHRARNLAGALLPSP
ncbi:MAG: TetR/AcrR family transcriptional regulator [Acidimicrobiaceae bacterium]|nr:TetR/AcrR family transcriptional regulator [Acidimicrobiaceae bacterium]